jgi:hypothetical protein
VRMSTPRSDAKDPAISPSMQMGPGTQSVIAVSISECISDSYIRSKSSGAVGEDEIARKA